jgi:hypothetical protein
LSKLRVQGPTNHKLKVWGVLSSFLFMELDVLIAIALLVVIQLVIYGALMLDFFYKNSAVCELIRRVVIWII